MYEIYTVKEGDTIESLAVKYNVDPALIYQINGFTPDYILSPNTNIVLPVRGSNNFEYYTIKKGDNLYKIAQDTGTDVRLLALLNGLNKDDYIYPNQIILVPRKGVSFYLVKQGDTLSSVIRTLNTSLNNILNQNQNIYLQPEQIIAFRENNI